MFSRSRGNSQLPGKDPRSPSRSYHHLAAIERFRISVWRVGLDTPDAHDRKKGIFRKPLFAALCSEAIDNCPDLPEARRLVKMDEQVRRPEIPVIFGDFVFKNQMIPESVPREFRDHPMILMEVTAVMGQN